MSRYLLVAPHNRSWGRAELAVRVAAQLRSEGHHARLLVHRMTEPLVRDAGLPYDLLGDRMGPLVAASIDAAVSSFEPDAIVYSDFATTRRYLAERGVRDDRFLLRYDAAAATLDIWDRRVTGASPDVLGRPLPFPDPDVSRRLLGRLTPVPIACERPAPGRFACLPERSAARRSGRRGGPKTVLFCTSPWQHGHALGNAGRCATRAVVSLLGRVVARMGPGVVLRHVGPRRLPLRAALGERYRWTPPLDARRMEAEVAQADLLVSANVSATTVSRAVVERVPVLLLENSRERGGVHPFRVWPLGYFRFLEPLLRGNGYRSAVRTIDLDEEQACEQMNGLLFDRAERDALAQNQDAYVRSVRRLPGAAQALAAL